VVGGGTAPHGGWNNAAWVAVLSANYRSHAALLDVPSQLFYGGQLEEHADPALTHSLLAWEGLPGQHPLLFYGVRGRDEAEVDSPSYFNLIEAETVS
jgi:superfamily I DNA and/or RNA helicase